MEGATALALMVWTIYGDTLGALAGDLLGDETLGNCDDVGACDFTVIVLYLGHWSPSVWGFGLSKLRRC